MEEFHARVSGRVQMVMYRDFTARKARKLGITGYVKNLSDRTVEVVAQGEKSALETLIAKLHRGSILSHVESVDVEWRTPTEQFDSFKIAF